MDIWGSYTFTRGGVRRSAAFSVLGGAVVLAGLTYTVIARTAGGRPQRVAHQVSAPRLSDISATTLLTRGIELLTPDTDARAVDRRTAERIAARGRGTKVRSAVLAVVQSSLDRAPNGCFCWVVSTVPPGGAYTTTLGMKEKVAYNLVFVDAVTGQLVSELGATVPGTGANVLAKGTP